MKKLTSVILVLIILFNAISPALAEDKDLLLEGYVGSEYKETVFSIPANADKIQCSLKNVTGTFLVPVVKDLFAVIEKENQHTLLYISFTGNRLGTCELDFEASYKTGGVKRNVSKHIVITIKDEKVEAAKQAFSSKAEEIKGSASDAWNQVKESTSSAAQNIGNTTSDVVESIGTTASEIAEVAGQKINEAGVVLSEELIKAREHLRDAVSKIDFSVFSDGWNFASKYFGSVTAAMQGQQYVSNVSKQIELLNNNISSRARQYANNSTASRAGFLAEDWAAGTYNIDAAVKGNKLTAKALGENVSGGADIVYQSGEKIVGEVGAKYYKTAEESAAHQAKYTNILQKYTEYCNSHNSSISMDDFLMLDENSDIFWSVYKDQQRLIPADQLKDAQNYLKRLRDKEAAKSGTNRQKLAASYDETLQQLTDRLKTADGSESIPLTKKEAEALAEASIKNDFKASEWASISSERVITPQYIVKQSMRSGATSAAIDAAMVLGPQIFQIIRDLIKNGTVDKEQLREAGISGLSAAGEGFLEGFISNALLVMCQAGKLGANFKNASPELIGTMTVIVINAAKYGYALAKGEITAAEYADLMAEDIVVSAAAVGGGMLLAMLLPKVPLIYLAGSIAGTLIASFLYDEGKKVVLAMVEDSDFDVIVLVDETKSELRDLFQLGTTKVSEAISSLKNLIVPSTDDVQIVLYDAT